MSDPEPQSTVSRGYIAITAELASAYVAHNPTPIAELPALLGKIHAALVGLDQGGGIEASATETTTVAQIRKSITHEALVSFIDGKPYKTLKRHLSTHGLTPDQYRDRFGLPADYPLVAAGYSQARSALAKEIGLGQVRRPVSYVAADSAKAIPEMPKRRGRPRNVAKAEA